MTEKSPSLKPSKCKQWVKATHSTSHAFENPLRPIRAIWITLLAGSSSVGCATCYKSWGLSPLMGGLIATAWAALASRRAWQALQLHRYQRRLLINEPFSLPAIAVPCDPDRWYLGQGFRWQSTHAQQLHLLNRSPWLAQQITSSAALGGAPWLHGIGQHDETAITLPQDQRNSHTLVFGRTRVGKSRLLATLVNQDIRQGHAVLVLDPKGDLSILQDMFEACQLAERLDDFYVVHAGLPTLSAHYNPLSQFSHPSEVATRIIGGLTNDSSHTVFRDFVWQFLAGVAAALQTLDEPITYKTLAYFMKAPRQLLMRYVDKHLGSHDPDYEATLEAFMQNPFEKQRNHRDRTEAMLHYVANYLEKQSINTLCDSLLPTLYHAARLDPTYYDKITASVGPLLDKINQTHAGGIFSWDPASKRPVVILEALIKRKQIIYIGLDALTNRVMSEAIGQAVIADLIALCGRLYKEAPIPRQLCLYADEFSDIVRDDFILLLNKAGGAGIQVTAFSQTLHDLLAAFGGKPAKPYQLLGNVGTVILLRVANLETAHLLTDCLATTIRRHTLPTSSTTQTQHGINTQNADTVVETTERLLTPEALLALPKGQAFVLTNGGELFKIRIPLLQRDPHCFETLDNLVETINLKEPYHARHCPPTTSSS